MKNNINKIKLGVVIPPKEYTIENINKIKENLIVSKNIKFLSPQFNNIEVSYQIVDVEVMPEATTAIIDDAINKDFSLNENKAVNSVISIVIDIGGGTMDIVAMENINIIMGSERTYNIGVQDALREIATEIEKKFSLENGFITNGQVNALIRYPISVCPKCKSTVSVDGVCDCGTKLKMKKNMFRVGFKAEDVSEIVDAVFDSITNKMTQNISNYINDLFKTTRGYSKNQLATVMLIGGGAEMMGDIVKNKIKSDVGLYADIIKPNNAIWKTLSGLSKYVIMSDKEKTKDFDAYVFVDMGNSSTKAKITDTNGKSIRKAIELLTQIATPINRSSIALRNYIPEGDLELQIDSIDDDKNTGNGKYFISILASDGKDIKTRKMSLPKSDDDITYVMINSAIAVLITLQ